MKTRLPKILLIAVLAAAVNSAVYAHGNYTVGDTVKVDTDITMTDAQKETFEQKILYNSATDANPKTIVKNGSGTLTIDKDVELHNPLHVTEGTLAITGGAKVTTAEISPTSGIAALSVGGKDATLVVDGASYSQPKLGMVYPITIGTTNGSGTLVLKNKAIVSSNQFVFAGYGHIKRSTGELHDCQGYVLGIEGYTGDDTGRSSIIVNDSTLKTGTSFQFADVDVTVTNGGVLEDCWRGESAVTVEPMKASWFGDAFNCSTVVNVEDRGSLNLNWRFETSSYASSSTTINVSGEGSTLKIADVAHLSKHEEGTTDINITDGATADINEVIVGEVGEATVTVGAGSTANVNAMTIGAAGEIVVGGSMSIENSLTLSKGAVITLEISDLSAEKMPGLTLNGDKEGDAVFQLLFTSEALAQMEKGMELDIKTMLNGVDTDILTDNTTITLTLADDVHANVADIFSRTYYITGSNSVITVKDTVAAVPEPTTATLSLLALAGLCARRRRR